MTTSVLLIDNKTIAPVVTFTANSTVVTAVNAGNYNCVEGTNYTVTFARYGANTGVYWRFKEQSCASPTVGATTNLAISFVHASGSTVSPVWEECDILTVTGKAVQNPTIVYADVADIAAFPEGPYCINTTTNSSNYAVVSGTNNITGTVDEYKTTSEISYRLYTVTCTTGTNPATHVPTMTFSMGTSARTMVFTWKYLTNCPACGAAYDTGSRYMIQVNAQCKPECMICGYDNIDHLFTET
jgi:hypothetical protein